MTRNTEHGEEDSVFVTKAICDEPGKIFGGLVGKPKDFLVVLEKS